MQVFAIILKEDEYAKTLNLSQASFSTKIYMNKCENHLGFIKDFQKYSKQYICRRCDQLFSQMQNLKRHQPKCDGAVEGAYLCSVCKNKLSVLQEFEEMSVQVSREDKYEK